VCVVESAVLYVIDINMGTGSVAPNRNHCISDDDCVGPPLGLWLRHDLSSRKTGLREVVWVKMPVFGTGRPLQTPPSMDPDHLVTLRKVT
jgi:hypothetical protein